MCYSEERYRNADHDGCNIAIEPWAESKIVGQWITVINGNILKEKKTYFNSV